MKNHYAILGISPSATLEQIKNAFSDRVLEINQNSPENKFSFQEMFTAYEILSDKDKRKSYDQELLNFYKGQFINHRTVNTPKLPTIFRRSSELVIKSFGKVKSGAYLFLYIIRYVFKNMKLNTFVFSLLALLLILFFREECNSHKLDHQTQTSEIGVLNHEISSNEFDKKVANFITTHDLDSIGKKINRTQELLGHPFNYETIPYYKPMPFVNKILPNKNDIAQVKYINTSLLDSLKLVNDGFTPQRVVNGDEPDCFNYTLSHEEIENKLIVEVGSGTDVVIKIMSVETGLCINYFYVNSGSTFTIYHIPQGRYYLKIAYGKCWMMAKINGQCKGKFLKDPLYEVGQEVLDFNIKHYEEGDKIPYFKLSLDVVASGLLESFKSKKISEAEFNK